MIETMNDFMVSTNGDNCVLLNPPRAGFPIDKGAALRLAAWLVVLCDMHPEHERFKEILSAIENT